MHAINARGVVVVDCVWNVMAHAQKPDFVFRWNGRVHLNRQGRQFSRLLAAEVCASAVVMVVMLDTPRSEVVWRVLATQSIRQFPLHFPSYASPCAITFQLDSTAVDQFHSFLTSEVAGRSTVSFMTRPLYTRGKRPRYPLNTTLGEPSADLNSLKRTALVPIGDPTRGRKFFPVL